MRITDARTGRHSEIRPRRTGLLRVTVDVGEPGRPFRLGDLRALLAGDVLARTCETHGLQVLTELAVPDAPDAPDGPDEQLRALRTAADRLGIHPPAHLHTHADTQDRPVADLTVTSRPDAHPEPSAPVLLRTGPVADDLPAPALAPEDDPLALRLALLEHAVTAPVRLTTGTLADAAEKLTRWRALVADLASMPSGAPEADLVQASFDGLDEDLDARVALRALDALEARTDLSPGTRFETFVRLDQILALELGRDIGRGPR
ncbi:hypothetical protein PUR71_05540 [Streptomyces sp. SP17BM10]|uniref:hypothetical protein n=1 Tax=Streptomyces sp. SP17BM10 TaxID=3002530 RepID=UPI002E75D8C9|nr:hypothetical protein [Streptomyces sp. SP17BM10]MEE1782392.1 hypothetical protein [Streptomyces sp. SP17BM10]